MRQQGRKQKKETFGGAVVDSLNEFLDAADRGEPITARRVKLNLEPRKYNKDEIKITRYVRLRVSQAIFAQLMGVSVKLVEGWERGSHKPTGPVCRLLEEINRDPQAFLRRYISESATRETLQAGTRPAPVAQ